MKENILTLNLSLFGEGGVGAASAEGASASSAPSAQAAVGADAEAARLQNERIAGWKDQMLQTRQVYPGFSMTRAMQNPKFRSLVFNNVDVRTAYEVTHKDRAYPRMMESAVRDIASMVMNQMSANQSRPAENGTSPTSAAVVKRDVSNMTREERQEIIRRVQKGEKISF